MPEVTLSSKGQIVLPRHLRKALGLSEGDRLSIRLENDHLEIRPIYPPPSLSWRRWRGRLRGTNALQDHLAEHADEVKRERLS